MPDPIGVVRATFTVSNLQDFQVQQQNGFTQPDFQNSEVTFKVGRYVKVADMGNNTEARVSCRSDGRYDIAVIHRGNEDLSKLTVSVTNGTVRRIKDENGNAQRIADGWLGHHPGGSFEVSFKKGVRSPLSAPHMSDSALMDHLKNEAGCSKSFIKAAKVLLDRAEKIQKTVDHLGKSGVVNSDDVRVLLPAIGRLNINADMKRVILLAAQNDGNNPTMLEDLEQALSYKDLPGSVDEKDRSQYRLCAFLKVARGLSGDVDGNDTPMDFNSVSARISDVGPAKLQQISDEDKNGMQVGRSTTRGLEYYEVRLQKQETALIDRDRPDDGIDRTNMTLQDKEHDSLKTELLLGGLSIDRADYINRRLNQID